jgi:hypothetical protein
MLHCCVRHRTRQLKSTALESLTLAVEVFNRPTPTARTQGVLLNLQHAFEMLVKAAIWQDRRRVGAKAGGRSYSFKECLGIVQAMGHLDENEALVAATIDAHRNGVQHQGADVTEERLYLDAASGLRLFDELLQRIFGERLAEHPTFANRMLPITANPPREFSVMTSADVEHIRDLLKPRRRRHAEAQAFLRTLALSDRVAQDPLAAVEQPSEAELDHLGRQLQKGKPWTALLPGLARLTLKEDEGVRYAIRVVKNSEAPGVRVVRPDEAGADDAVSILKVTELERYKFGLRDLAGKLKLNQYETRALVALLDLAEDERFFKELRVGGTAFKRYSHEAFKRLRQAKLDGRVAEAKVHLRRRQQAKRKAA